MTGFLGAVALVNADTTRNVKIGNQRLVEWIAHRSNATIHLSTAVTRISRTNSGQYEILTSGSDSPQTFDVVVIATPIEFASIDLKGVGESNIQLLPRNYTGKHVTFVKAKGLNTTYFQLPNDNIQAILTTQRSQQNGVPFYSIGLRQKLSDSTFFYFHV